MQVQPSPPSLPQVISDEKSNESPYLTAKYIAANRAFTVMSCDGGGVRGIIPATIIEEICKRSGLELYQFTNLAVGTSTGGLLTAAYLGHTGDQQPLFKASEVIPFWKENVTEIFHPRCLFDGFDGWFKSRYTAEGLESVIEKVAHNKMNIKEHLLRPSVFTSFDATAFKPFYFRSRDVDSSSDPSIYQVKKVLRCTTAAPGYLPAQKMLINDVAHAFLDGGLVNNNPTMVGLEEARCLAHPNRKIEVLSFGTGVVDQSINYKSLSDAGFTTYAPLMLNIFFGGMESHPNILLTERPACLQEKEFYQRFQVTKLDDEHSELDSVKSLDYLEAKAKEWISVHEEVLEKVSSRLTVKDDEDPYAKPIEF